jgi:membrane protein CcdC involved in cytochrome C biogenesis
MKGFLATGFLLLKSNKEYVITFKILEQVLVGLFFSILANLVQTKVVQYN